MKTLLRITAGLMLLAASVMHSQDVLTKSLDNSSTSEYRSETILTPAAVAAKGMVRLPDIPVVGDAIGMDSQGLIDGNVMVLASEGNVVRGVVPNGGAAIWQTLPLCTPVKSDRNNPSQNDMWHVSDNFGIISTPVIDKDTHRVYVVPTCSLDGSGSQASMQQRLFVLDDRTGAILVNRLVQGTDQGMNYADAPRKQRAGLLLWNYKGVKFVMVMAGSFSENGSLATGWLLGLDTYDNTFKFALSTKAGGWLSGGKPIFDPKTGLIYIGLGNGPYDGVHKFGEAVLQIKLTPPNGNNPGSLRVLHSWAPFSDDDRTCKTVYPANKVAGTNATTQDVPGAKMVMPEDDGNCNAAWGDQDAHLSLTGLFDINKIVTAGKDGRAYIIPTNPFPDTFPADFQNPTANCAKVIMFEGGWDLGIPPCPLTAAALNRLYGGKTRHQHSPIVQYHSPSGKLYLLFFAENSPLQVVRIDPDGTPHFVVRGTEMASANVQSGMPGGFGIVTSNNGANAMAWYSIPLGDANRTVTTGYLAAYDLTHIEDPVPTLPTVWKSAPYVFNKFGQPITSNGILTLANGAGSVMQYKLNQ